MLFQYMRGQVGPSTKELSSMKDFEKFIGSDEHSVIGSLD